MSRNRAWSRVGSAFSLCPRASSLNVVTRDGRERTLFLVFFADSRSTGVIGRHGQPHSPRTQIAQGHPVVGQSGFGQTCQDASDQMGYRPKREWPPGRCTSRRPTPGRAQIGHGLPRIARRFSWFAASCPPFVRRFVPGKVVHAWFGAALSNTLADRPPTQSAFPQSDVITVPAGDETDFGGWPARNTRSPGPYVRRWAGLAFRFVGLKGRFLSARAKGPGSRGQRRFWP
jgi:hypothetical protein